MTKDRREGRSDCALLCSSDSQGVTTCRAELFSQLRQKISVTGISFCEIDSTQLTVFSTGTYIKIQRVTFDLYVVYAQLLGHHSDSSSEAVIVNNLHMWDLNYKSVCNSNGCFQYEIKTKH